MRRVSGGVGVVSLVVVLAGFAVAGCTKNEDPRHALTVTLAELRAGLDPVHPGRGLTDYPSPEPDDIPKAYAMVLLAELALARRDHQPIAAAGVAAGEWLLANADANRDGVIGWGVPIAWDAYGDGSVNPANTEYAISTAIVIHSLLDWMDASPQAPVERILALVEQAFRPYLEPTMRSPVGLLPYSFRESDRIYDTFNPAAYLAGQMQRYSRRAADRAFAAALQDAADQTMAALLAHRKTSPEGGRWYWHYSVQEAVPNDLPHAGYIVDGVRAYIENGGRLAEKFDRQKVVAHLLEFPGDDSLPLRAWPRFYAERALPARSYGLGIAMHIACGEDALEPLRRTLFAQIPVYRKPEGRYMKYPVGSDRPNLVVAEYEAFLFRGIASCLARTAPTDTVRAPSKGAPGLMPGGGDRARVGGHTGSPSQERSIAIERAVAVPNIDRYVQVPLARLPAGAGWASIFFDTAALRSRVKLHNGRQFAFPMQGVPLDMQQTEPDRHSIAFRHLPRNTLSLVEWHAGTGEMRSQIVGREGVDYLLFRGAVSTPGRLYWIVYDNRVGKNYLRRYERRRGSWQQVAEWELPSVEDPAGGTYEMIPQFFLIAEASGGVRILGGTLNARLHGDELQVGRFKDCEKVIEAVPTPVGSAVLCGRKTSDALGAYVIHDPSRSEPLRVGVADGVPWRLGWNAVDGRAEVRLARDAREYAEMFAYDMERGQNSGMLEFGSDNIEGRFAWSQIYYLNGLMDIVYLARKDRRADAVFAPLLPAIRLRLELEMRLLDRLLSEPVGMRSRAFTRDRSLALFAVQTSRALLLLLRYQQEFPDAPPLANLRRLRDEVPRLTGHIEILASQGEEERWLAPGLRHLRWPKGSAFPFDGLAVPYNHQNEWAYSVFESKRADGAANDTKELEPQREIVRHFLRHLAADGRFPLPEKWQYWWGHAFDGYDAASGRSLNKPEYVGDKILAWISFRTIDLMSVLAGLPFMPDLDHDRLRSSALERVEQGQVYPFAARSLIDLGLAPQLRSEVALRYARSSSPWELANQPWALTMLVTPP